MAAGAVISVAREPRIAVRRALSYDNIPLFNCMGYFTLTMYSNVPIVLAIPEVRGWAVIHGLGVAG